MLAYKSELCKGSGEGKSQMEIQRKQTTYNTQLTTRAGTGIMKWEMINTTEMLKGDAHASRLLFDSLKKTVSSKDLCRP